MPASTYLGNALLNHVLRGVAYTAPTGVYVSLHTADPGLTGANEVSTGSWPAYAREEAAQGGALADAFAAASAKATENANEILWAANDGAGSVIVTHVGLWDAASGGNFLFGAALAAPKTVAVTDEIKFAVGQLDITVDP
ncbi:phage tail fiber protein [Oricola sp.]|uniref:phage tail fiber protein n=1 Tax=Oricola sp. TaxID=1979950 RepID=UPI003BA8A394